MPKENIINKKFGWPIGSARLVQKMGEIPEPKKFMGVMSGYLFYKTRYGEYAILNQNFRAG